MSTIDPLLPVQGVPYNAAPIRENFGAAIADIDALESLNAGDSPPAAPVLGVLWLDTSPGTTYTLKIWSDRQSQWVPIAALDSLNSLWISPVGGGLPVSLLADDTTDLGSVPQTVETITGSGPIYSFGTSAPAGIVKVLTFDGATQIIYNATSMILPGLADLTTDAGSMGIAVALGSGNWQILYYQTNTLLPAQGGTGRTTLTAHSVLLGEGTAPVNFAVPATAGYPLLSTGASSDPAFGQVNLTVGVTGILPVPNGGTGLAAVAAHYLIIGNGTSALTPLAPGTIAYPLVSRGPTLDPYYAILTPSGGGTGLAAITTHNLIIGNGTSTPTLLAPSATSGVPLISQGAAADPAYGVAVVPGGGTGGSSHIIHGVLLGQGAAPLGIAVPGATGYSLLSTGATSDPAFGQVSLTVGVTGILPVPNGGTGGSSHIIHGVLLGQGAAPLGIAVPATSAYPLISNGAGADPSFQQLNLAGAGVTGVLPAVNLPPPITRQNIAFAGSTTAFTIPATTLILKLIGAGGGGGGGTPDAGAPGGGGGGGAGAFVIYSLFGLTVGNTLTITVGAPGIAGVASAAGGDGGDVVVSSGTETITSATAGGGKGGTAGVGPAPIPGGIGGVGSGGIIGQSGDFNGGNGALGFSIPSLVGIPGTGGVISTGVGPAGYGGQGGTADTVSGAAGIAGMFGGVFIEWLSQ